MTHNFHKFWLKITAFVIGFFGPVLTFGTMVSTMEPARLGLDILAWPIDGFPTYQYPDMRFLSALTGGFLVGWGVMVLLLSLFVYDKAPEGVRKTVVISLLGWFIFDSIGSIASGNPANAFFNVIVLLICVGPMWIPAKSKS